MFTQERWEQAESAQKAALDRLQSKIWTMLPCEVSGLYSDGQHVDLQPLISILFRSVAPNGNVVWTATKMPTLPMVPIKFPSGGGYTLTFPVKIGDEGTVSFASRCIDNWWAQGGVQPQLSTNNSGSLRKHNLSDGFFELGGRSKPKLLSSISQNSVQLRSDDGTCAIDFSKTGTTFLYPSGNVIISPSGDLTTTGNVVVGTGATGTFVSADGKDITVMDGIVVNITP